MSGPSTLPLHLRVHFTHAFLQFVADTEGIDLLHVKGPALHPDLLQRDAEGQPVARSSTDADVLVRPQDARRFLKSLEARGCMMHTSFATGSPFEHAATMWSEHLGYADIHRFFPGIGTGPEQAFDDLWTRRETIEVAHRPIAVPSVLDQRLLILLHAARSGFPDNSDKRRAWDDATDDQRSAVRARAHDLKAEVALAAAIGELDRHRLSSSYSLWDQFSRHSQHSRTAEWAARLRAAPTPLGKLAVATRALRVNSDRLALELGHQPTRQELRAAYVARFRRAARELLGRDSGER